MCVKNSCTNSCLKCRNNSNICEECPTHAIFTNDYTTCTCPLNSIRAGDECVCIMQNAYFKDYNKGCDCIDGYFLTSENSSIYCHVNFICSDSCVKCYCNSD
jgi:hypothetical protein